MKSALLMLILLFLFSSCGPKFDEKVVVIEKTRIYHRPMCSQVMMARATCETRAEAKEKGYRPCPYCLPDRGLAGKPDHSK